MKFKLAAFADEAGSALSDQIAALTENEIEFLEIRGVNGVNVSDLTENGAREIAKTLQDAGISVWSVGSPFGKIAITDDFSAHLDKFRRGVETALALGAKRMRIFSFYIPEGENPDIFRDEVLERLCRFRDEAKGSGVLLCHENEKRIFGDIPSRCADISKSVPEISAVFDPANFVQCGVETRAAWELLSPHVEYLHIKDAQKDGKIVPAGRGDGEIPYILSRYSGSVLTVEPHLFGFDGLSTLEREGDRSHIGESYATARSAFDAAVSALKSLIE